MPGGVERRRTVTRLEAISRVMREAFSAATDAQRALASRTACESAVKAADLAGPDVEIALAVLREDATPDPSLSRRLRERSEQHDAESSRLEEDEGPSDASHLRFRQARAAAALVEALEDDLAEALYEAIYATDDVEDAITRVIDALRA